MYNNEPLKRVDPAANYMKLNYQIELIERLQLKCCM